MSQKLSYHSIVDYDTADPAKVLAQKEAAATASNLPFGFKEIPGTRGESAYVFNMGEFYGALVQEGLGTKSLIAQSIYEKTGKSYFGEIAQDTVATFINDLISVGATPVVTNAYWSSSSYEWLADRMLTENFIKGWRTACDKAKITWGGGETQALSGIIDDGALELAGCAFGVIKDKNRLIDEKNLREGDAILLIESSGVHANGISLARQIAVNLDNGYATQMKNGVEFGEALLSPTFIYSDLIEKLFEKELDIHYLSNVTGHGWRKLMRATAEYTYEIEVIPPVQEVFKFIAEHSSNDEKEMYGNYNMGAGYAIYIPKDQAQEAQKIAAEIGYKSWISGSVKKGAKKVDIKPLGIVFEGSSLGVR